MVLCTCGAKVRFCIFDAEQSGPQDTLFARGVMHVRAPLPLYTFHYLCTYGASPFHSRFTCIFDAKPKGTGGASCKEYAISETSPLQYIFSARFTCTCTTNASANASSSIHPGVYCSKCTNEMVP